MEKIIDKISSLVEKIEKSRTNFVFWSVSFLSIIALRVLSENWLTAMESKTGDYFFHHVFYTFIFFFLAYLIFLGILKKFLKVGMKEASNIMLLGYLIIITPPIIDYLILGDKFYLSFYGLYSLKDMPIRFFTFFGDRPDFGVTYGVRIEIALTSIFLFIYGYIKTRNWIKSILLSFYSYATLFFLATFPSWVTIFIEGSSKGFLKVGEVEMAKMFLSPTRLFSRDVGSFTNALSIKLSLIYSLLLVLVIIVGAYFNYREKLVAFLKNARIPQIIYHSGLFIVGIGLAIKFTKTSWDFDFFNFLSLLVLLTAIVFAWLSSVVVNDLNDEKIDRLSNKNRPLVLGIFSRKEYAIIGALFFSFSIFFSANINPKAAMILVAYQALAWVYSSHPFRLKRFLFVATFVSAIASMLIMILGFVVAASDQSTLLLPSSIMWLLAISFTLSLPIKDLKDIEGDRADGVFTVPVVLGENWGKIAIGSGIFISYILSVLFLREYSLTFWAIIFGGASFWIVILSGENKKITHRNVIWWVLGIVAIYSLILLSKIL